MDRIRVLVWNEFVHERTRPEVAAIYPDGIHMTIRRFLAAPGYEVRSATLDEPEHGLTEQALAETDVLVWFGHARHDDVLDAVAERVARRVCEGMGFVPLHSSHMSKPFRLLMGTGCMLKWRQTADREHLWCISPSHPIADGASDPIILEHEETYGEHFDVPEPDQIVYLGWFSGGEVFRSGCCYTRGLGRIFYFQPGHETYPTFHHPDIQRVITNSVRWVAPRNTPMPYYGNFRSVIPAEGERA